MGLGLEKRSFGGHLHLLRDCAHLERHIQPQVLTDLERQSALDDRFESLPLKGERIFAR